MKAEPQGYERLRKLNIMLIYPAKIAVPKENDWFLKKKQCNHTKYPLAEMLQIWKTI